ncbi:MAG: GntR family transcriptional regulator [Bacteroidetes bacterium]|uniref:GntR family transcriptional regulator n=1 Tax=Candidatus Cryptobacteroides excrementipullorum TaxID=2840761 RepID=A0A9D9IUF7_9BACT|nr:GntR family transcriptional regulator [Candidatus Cryptobacteroides excrementipullorum]
MDYQLDHNSSKPLHAQAEELIREMIRQDEYRKGKLLPNEVELSQRLSISRNTLRQAINKLVMEGLLVRKKGYGTTVAPQNVMSNARNWKSFSQEMRSQGLKVQNFELHISYKAAPEEALKFFGLKTETSLLCLERLRGKPGLPFVYFISYFNPSIPMSVEDDMSLPLYEILEKKYGITVKTSKEMIFARGANAGMAEKLGIDEGAPVLVRKRFVLDRDNVPVEYNVGYYRADSFTYSIEFTND